MAHPIAHIGRGFPIRPHLAKPIVGPAIIAPVVTRPYIVSAVRDGRTRWRLASHWPVAHLASAIVGPYVPPPPVTTVSDLGIRNTSKLTELGMTGSDVAFTFNPLMRFAQVQASAATSSMYLASASAGHAPYVLPNGQNARPLQVQCDMAGLTVTFNGTNTTTVDIIEYFYAST